MGEACVWGEEGMCVWVQLCVCVCVSAWVRRAQGSVPHEESRKLIFEIFVNLVCHGTC